MPWTRRALTPDPDGARTDFTAPTAFVAGTARAVVNGVAYDPSDDQWGYSELSTTEIRFANPPKAGFGLMLDYQEPVVSGSPFDPSGVYP